MIKLILGVPSDTFENKQFNQMKITLVIGGARSGKSSFAQKKVEEECKSPIYLATARIWDADFKQRVQRHQNDRSDQWTTIEEEVTLSKLDLNGKHVLLDCVTLWLTNIFHDNKYDIDKALDFAKKEWKAFTAQDFDLTIVTNEIGMGVHPEHESARKFADLQGWVNQFIAAQANEVYFMVSGISVKIK